MIKCLYCGEENPDDSDFCSKCGHMLRKKQVKVGKPSNLLFLAIIWFSLGSIWLFVSAIALPLQVFLMRAGLTAGAIILLLMIILGPLMGVSLIVSAIGFWRGRPWSVGVFKVAFVLTVSYLTTLAYDDVVRLGIEMSDIIVWIFYGLLFVSTFLVLQKPEIREYLGVS